MFVAVLLTTILAVQQANDNSLPGNVKKLVRGLAAAELAVREKAEADLVALGAPALPHLPEVTARTPAEVAVRLKRIRVQLQAANAEDSSKASLVSLTGEMKLSEALTALTQQTENQFHDHRAKFGQPAADPSLTLDLDNVPFWQAVDQIFGQAKLMQYHFSGISDTIAYVTAPDGHKPATASYHGVFRFSPTRLVASRNLQTAESDILRLMLDVSWEPKLKPIHLEQNLTELTVTDDTGAAIAIDNRRATLRPAVESGQNKVELQLPMALPARSVQKIAKLTGKLTALATGPTEKFEFHQLDAQKSQEIRKAGATVILDQVRANRKLHQVRMRIRFDESNNALESHRGWVYKNDAYALDADGKRIENLGSETTGQRQNEVGMSYLFDFEGDSKNFTFVYESPAAIMRIPVEYELTDIALP